MPSSFVNAVVPIVCMIIDAAPKRIIDVGPGWGKYGVMCREYLPDLKRIDAIEVEEGRIFTQQCIYDHVFERDARHFQDWHRYDLVLLIDVLEHMSKEDGHALLRAMLQEHTNVLVSTPKLFIEQHDENNPYEEHVCLWTRSELSDTYKVKADGSTADSIIYLIG